VSIERTGDSGNHLTAITVTFRIAFPDGEVGDKARAILPGAGGTEIGWRLARHAWHRGYATEAALAARDVAFTGVGLPELWSMTAVLNTPSQTVMRRIGMTEAARFEHPRVPGGSPLKPHVVYHLDSSAASA